MFTIHKKRRPKVIQKPVKLNKSRSDGKKNGLILYAWLSFIILGQQQRRFDDCMKTAYYGFNCAPVFP